MEGLSTLAYVAAVIVAADVGLTAYDAVMAAKGERPHPAMCAAEIVIAAPQIPVGFAFAKSSGPGERPLGVGLAAWTSLLVVHGVWGLVASASRASAEPTAAGTAANVSPASLRLGLRLGGEF